MHSKNQLNMTLGCILFRNEPQCYSHQWCLCESGTCVSSPCSFVYMQWNFGLGFWSPMSPVGKLHSFPAPPSPQGEFTRNVEVLKLNGPEENLVTRRSRARVPGALTEQGQASKHRKLTLKVACLKDRTAFACCRANYYANLC